MCFKTWSIRGRTTIEGTTTILIKGPTLPEAEEEAEETEAGATEEAETSREIPEGTEIAMMTEIRRITEVDTKAEVRIEEAEEVIGIINVPRRPRPEVAELHLTKTAGNGSTKTRSDPPMRELLSNRSMMTSQSCHQPTKSNKGQAKKSSTER